MYWGALGRRKEKKEEDRQQRLAQGQSSSHTHTQYIYTKLKKYLVLKIYDNTIQFS